ncbi:HTH-type transcriptional regulator MtrR [Caloramator mitchellensis]|uniref:HTH-type transcriptional regulator MtrR n=1 Tax=Caloramator mitchellensis TaxID=908809 RepID=A0A0R3JW81_CALMK|nr:TetR/AcrR family transcriptional regulator [Caloramator mitchellensis]KRQ87840.1 HTH-type transcriptional regulator MtrR [Caloramator mitchellensis]
MAVAFTDYEKEIIREKLILSAKECLKKYGVKKTTVDELSKMAGISKGAFYIFFESKEALFFEVLEDFQKNIFKDAFKDLDSYSKDYKYLFTETIFNLIISVKNSFIINIIKNNEIELIYRKLPEKVLLKHDDFDEALANHMIEKFNLENKIDKNVLVAVLRAIFMTLLHEREIGNNFDEAIKILIEGLANSIFEVN